MTDHDMLSLFAVISSCPLCSRFTAGGVGLVRASSSPHLQSRTAKFNDSHLKQVKDFFVGRQPKGNAACFAENDRSIRRILPEKLERMILR